MSSTPPVWFFSGIAHSQMVEPMVTTHCFIVLKSRKSIQLLCYYWNFRSEFDFSSATSKLYQIMRKVVQYLNFLWRANFVWPNYWSHSLLYNFEGLKCLSSVPLVRYYKIIYILTWFSNDIAFQNFLNLY